MSDEPELDKPSEAEIREKRMHIVDGAMRIFAAALPHFCPVENAQELLGAALDSRDKDTWYNRLCIFAVLAAEELYENGSYES